MTNDELNAIQIIRNMLDDRKKIRNGTDNSFDKIICPTDDEWDAIEELLNAVEGEF
jgi:uncharacterized protein YrzB (UPF0473 family)